MAYEPSKLDVPSAKVPEDSRRPRSVGRLAGRRRWGARPASGRSTFLRGALLLMACLGAGLPSPADESIPLQLSSKPASATAVQDDAELRDVTFIGNGALWAVGDRGVVWKSGDGGKSWQFVPLPQQYSDRTLHSVCFLTDRVGWIAGGWVVPVAGTAAGVLLHTTGGGETWQPVSEVRLPYLRYVRFFDLDRGVVVGEPTPQVPSGIMTTDDGGESWQAVGTATRTQWTAAAFVGPGAGLVVGPRGLRGSVSGEQLLLSPGLGGLAGFNAVSADRQGRGWLVGDGAALLTTDNAGASWALPPETLPRDLADFCELSGVCHIGEKVWCVGTPGSVVWHSPDAGRSWQRQSTDSVSPLEAVRFVDPLHGCAVGAFGRIAVTSDGGQTWTTVRGGRRRVAVLAVHSSARRLPHQLVTRLSLEDGYRCAVTLAPRRDIGPDAHAHLKQKLEFQQAISAEGAVAGEIGWRLPIAIPGLEAHREQLIREWSLLTDGQLGDLLLGHLVSRIRMWRPDVVIIDEFGNTDVAREVLQQAMIRAVKRAADDEAFPHQAEYGLSPWPVRKLFGRRPEGTSGAVRIDPYQVLVHLGTTLDQAVLRGAGRLSDAADVLSPEQYQLLYAAEPSEAAGQSIVADLGLKPGSEARRALVPVDPHDVDRLLEQAQQRRIVTSLGEQMVERPETAASLLAQLSDLVAPLSPAQAAQQLADVAAMHRRRGQLDLAEQTYALLMTQYPEQPPAIEAMKWLVNQWTSVEVNWQRLRTMRGERSVAQTDHKALKAHWEKAVELIQQAETQTARDLAFSRFEVPLQTSNSPIALTSGDLNSVLGPGGNSADQRVLRMARWLEMATATMEHVIAQRPQVWSAPEVQFSYAALMRRRLRHKQADEVYNRFLSQISDDPWHQAARGEAWLLRPGPVSPKPVMICRTASEPPLLDGILSDVCWTAAGEVQLSARGERSPETFVGTEAESGGRVEFLGPRAIVMLCHDERFLYIGASIPRHPQGRPEQELYAGRVHDADLTPFDRVILHLDVDRDYNTYYTFAVDQRGWTYEACWEDASYNPKWYVAADADERHWRIEAAIPLAELVPSSPVGQTWGVGITRIIPGLGWETWTNSGAEVPQPARFGLVQFLH